MNDICLESWQARVRFTDPRYFCPLCGQEVMEGNGYNDGFDVYHKDCAFDYMKGLLDEGYCPCGGFITEEGYCEKCGMVADEESLNFIYG